MAERNYMEDIIKEVLEQCFQYRDDVCKCEICKEYIIQKVAERISPHHVSDHHENAKARIQTVDNQLRADVMKEITFVIEMVKANPPH